MGQYSENCQKLLFDFSVNVVNKFRSPRTSRNSLIREFTKRQSKMVKIRLRREGSKDRPYYKIVVTDGRARREGAYIEQVGTHDPMKDSDRTKLDLVKVDEWIGKGAQPSDTVRSLIKKARQSEASA